MGLLSAYSNQKCVYQGIASSERCSVASWQRPEGASPSRLLCGCLSLPEVNLLGQIPSGTSRQWTNHSGANSNPRHCYEGLPWPALHRLWAFLFSRDMSSCLELVKWLWWCIFSYSLQWVQWINEIEKSRTSSWLTINLEDSALLTQWSVRNGWPFFSEQNRHSSIELSTLWPRSLSSHKSSILPLPTFDLALVGRRYHVL